MSGMSRRLVLLCTSSACAADVPCCPVLVFCARINSARKYFCVQAQCKGKSSLIVLHAQSRQLLQQSNLVPATHPGYVRTAPTKAQQHKRHQWQHLCHDALSVYTCVDASDMLEPASATWQVRCRLASVMCPAPATIKSCLHMLCKWRAVCLNSALP